MGRDLLDKLETLKVEVRVEGDKLKWKALKGVMTDSLKAQIKIHKAELLALLRDKHADTYQEDCKSFSSKNGQHQADSVSEKTDKQLPLNKIILGDCLEKLKTIPDNSIDVIVTDSPYGLKFMGKNWDKAIPSINIWKECLRVLKPGGFAFVMSSPRQDQLTRMNVNLENAGFKIDFTSLYWTQAQGMTHAHNISKAIDKKLGVERKKMGRNPNSRETCDKSHTIYESGTVGKTAYYTEPATEEAKRLDGSYAGFQPKPAVEVIIVAMKPCDKKTYTDQALSNGKGCTWLHECRIPYKDEEVWSAEGGVQWSPERKWNSDCKRSGRKEGRFPANLLISDDVLDDGKKHKSGRMNCIAKNEGGVCYGKYNSHPAYNPGDTGGYSRYFSLDAWAEKNIPFLIVSKASKKEKDAGLEGLNEKPIKGRDPGQDNRNVAFKARPTPRKNTHPTVKPIKLMAYLITMGSRENDIVLDPFAGSGSTCIAAKLLNRKFIGIEISNEYHEISVRRLENAFGDDTIKKLFNEFKTVKGGETEKNRNASAQEKLEKHSVSSKDPELRLNVLP